MKISARNVLSSTVKEVTKGAVNAQVTLELDGGEKVVSTIANSSVDSLGLVEGGRAYAIVKASEVIVGKSLEGARLSARNVLAGVVTKVVEGAVHTEVEIRLVGGSTVVASITRASAESLELKAGDAASAIVKASSVMVGA